MLIITRRGESIYIALDSGSDPPKCDPKLSQGQLRSEKAAKLKVTKPLCIDVVLINLQPDRQAANAQAKVSRHLNVDISQKTKISTPSIIFITFTSLFSVSLTQ